MTDLNNDINIEMLITQLSYNRLCAIDPSLSTLLLYPATADTDFKETLQKIYDHQKIEYAHLHKFHSHLFTPSVMKVLSFDTDHLHTVESLEKIDAVLNTLNATIIQGEINKNQMSGSLNLSAKGITRIPFNLLEQKNNPLYWDTLRSLDCSNNFISNLTLPKLSALNILICNNNVIQIIRGLEDLPSLQSFSCQYNKITNLNLNPLIQLTELDCSYNLMYILELKGLTSLKNLHCYSHAKMPMRFLSLKGLTALHDFHCDAQWLFDLDLENVPPKIKNRYENFIREVQAAEAPEPSMTLQAPSELFLPCFDSPKKSNLLTIEDKVLKPIPKKPCL